MAKLFYGAQQEPIEIPDLLLAHVKVVIATKLRRNECFMMSWAHADGSGRSSIWVQPSIPMRFVFESAEAPQLDRALLASLAVAASSNSGLVLRLDDLGLTESFASAPAPSPDRERVLTAA
ncbi:hypothetical protein MK786_04575 [Microbacterium sp. CFH 31415]|uniref:DUF7882 family protein n=1 Tax=Microbacterium sp. CFH 31415 TaxID=2921732 RepID=UPI001F13F8C7|nr:hypothetical protein [Microbacterium sp. CFH 31415]MCH6230010.1 hypothetical protein [Microbacterium sp. CFH 31415]